MEFGYYSYGSVFSDATDGDDRSARLTDKGVGYLDPFFLSESIELARRRKVWFRISLLCRRGTSFIVEGSRRIHPPPSQAGARAFSLSFPFLFLHLR